MKTILTTAALSLALAMPAFAQDAKPAIPPAAPADVPAVKPVTPKAATPAVKVEAPKAAAPAVKVETPKVVTPAVKSDVAKPAAAAVKTEVKTPAATPAKTDVKAVPGKLIDLNTATAAELDALPSIGKARTKAIIAGRPYKSVDDLIAKKVLPKDSFEAIKGRVSVK